MGFGNITSGSDAGEGMGWRTELSWVGQAGGRYEDAQDWSLETRTAVLD